MTDSNVAADPDLHREKREKLIRHKAMIAEYYDFIINKKDFASGRKFIGSRYVQHNPDAEDGPEGLSNYIDWLKATFPDLKVDFKRIVADGDFVIMHNIGLNSPGGMAVVDIFLIEDGKAVEHWDVLQPVPERTVSGNPMA